MKLIAIAAAGLAALAGVAPAGAQTVTRTVTRSDAPVARTVTTRTVVHTHTGPAYRHHTRRVCRVHYRNHRRVRVCRVVRY